MGSRPRSRSKAKRVSQVRPSILGLFVFTVLSAGVMASSSLIGQVQPRVLVNPVIIDDGETGFSVQGPAAAVSFPRAYLGDFRYIRDENPDNLTTATWEFTRLSAGTYEIYATWVAFGSNNHQVSYSLASGINQDAIVIDQRSPPSGATYGGDAWHLLGRMEVTENANSLSISARAGTKFTILDAVAIVQADSTPTNNHPLLRPNPAPPQAEFITLESIIFQGDSVIVDYTKNFDTCVHLLTDDLRSTNDQDPFCERSGPITVPRRSFNAAFVPGGSYKLCHGNNTNVCSKLFTLPEPDVTLHSIVIQGNNVIVDYTKSFSPCARLMTSNSQSVQKWNPFCGLTGPVTTPRLAFTDGLVVGGSYRLCNGNNIGVCSGFVTATEAPVPVSSSSRSSSSSSKHVDTLPSSSSNSSSSSSSSFINSIPREGGYRCENGSCVLCFGAGCTDSPSVCQANCKSSSSSVTPLTSAGYCGDKLIQTGEQCDDGNMKPGDGCSKTCQRESCGDGIVSPSLGEECDGGDSCNTQCKWLYCGDSILKNNEQCDDGNVRRGDGCDEQCQIEKDGPASSSTASSPADTPATLAIVEKVIGSTDVATRNQKDIVLSRFEVRAGSALDVLFTGISYTAAPSANLLNAQNYTLWVDTDGNNLVDTILERGVAAQNNSVTLSNLLGGGYVIPKEKTIAFEVHADVSSSTASDTIQLKLNSSDASYVTAEHVADGTELQGISTNGKCAQTCTIFVSETTSKKYTIASRGSLFVTKSNSPVPSRQLLGGTLGDAVLRVTFRAQDEGIDVTDLQITSLDSDASSVDRLELYKAGEANPFTIATIGSCGSDQVPTTVNGQRVSTFCARMEARQLVIFSGQQTDVIVRPRMKTDENGAVSGQKIRFFIASTPVADSASGRGAVRARGIVSSSNLGANNGDTSATGEIFIGTNAPGANQDITSTMQTVSLSRIVSIQNANPDADGVNIPTGISPVGQFKFIAAVNNNTQNGTNRVEIADIIFTVRSSNLQLNQDSFKIYNKADSSIKSPCRLVDSSITSPTIYVACWNISAGGVDTTIDSGGSNTYVLEVEILNPQTNSNQVSGLRVSIDSFTDPTKNGISSNLNHIRWLDTDTSSNPFYWIDNPENIVNSTQYGNPARIIDTGVASGTTAGDGGGTSGTTGVTRLSPADCNLKIKEASRQIAAYHEQGPFRTTSDKTLMLYAEKSSKPNTYNTPKNLKLLNTKTCTVTTLVDESEVPRDDGIDEMSISDNGKVLYAIRGVFYQKGNPENIRGKLFMMDLKTGVKHVIHDRVPSNGTGDRATLSRDGKSIVITASFNNLDTDPATAINNNDGSRELFLWKDGVFTQITNFVGGPDTYTNMHGAIFEDPAGRFISIDIDFDPTTLTRHEIDQSITIPRESGARLWESRLYLYDTVTRQFHRLTEEEVRWGARGEFQNVINQKIEELKNAHQANSGAMSRFGSIFSLIGSLLSGGMNLAGSLLR